MKKLSAVETGKRRHDGFVPTFTIDVKHDFLLNEEIPITDEHCLTATIFVTFYASKEQYQTAERIAIRRVYDVIYEGMPAIVNDIRAACIGGDKKRALDLCHDLFERMVP